MADLWEESFPSNRAESTVLAARMPTRARSSGFKLVVEFGGICCFAPAADGKSMGVFLANKSGDPEDANVPRHKAVVQFPLARVKGVSGVPETSQGLWKPVAREIRFAFDGEPETRELEIIGFDSQTGNIPEQPLEISPAEHFYWVSSVGDAFRSHGLPPARVRAGLTRNVLSQSDAEVLAARVLLTRGKLRPTSFVRDGDLEQFVVWRFSREGALDDDQRDHRQFVASRVVLEMDVPAESVRIMARDMVTGHEETVVELAPNGSNTVNVVILNEESDEILGVGSPPQLVLGRLREQDRIFRSVLKLLEPGPRPEEVPIPIAVEVLGRLERRRDGVVRNSPPCSPYRVDG